MIGARLERPGKPGLAGPLTLAMAIRLQRIRNRVTSLAARWVAGTLTPRRQRPPRPGRRKAAPGPWDHLPKLPRGRAWLLRMVPGIGAGASQLEALLAEREMAALVAAAPQIGRTLRPFFRILGREPPPALRRPPVRRPRPATAAPASDAATPPDRPRPRVPRPVVPWPIVPLP